MKTLNSFLYLFILCCFSWWLLACSDNVSAKKNEVKTYEVRAEAIHKMLYFTGTIQPLGENTLTNPMDGVIEIMHFHYGDLVKKGDVIFTLNSTELQKQYNDTLTDYLKTKDNYTIARAKFTGTQELWQAGLLSKNNYLSEKSSLITARVSLIQATHKLSEMLEKMGDSTYQNLSTLSFEEFDKVRLALTSKHNLVYLKSPRDGILLYPPKSGEDKTSHLTVGASVKSGQVLALIGDLRGIHVEIDVPEVDIDKIKLGMAATIRSVAFPKDMLKGHVVSINAQASTSNGGALPSFTAIVEVKNLNVQQQAWIKVGMSAAIELSVDSTDKLLVPIAAIKQKHGESVVQVRTEKGAVKQCVITTGAAEADKVVVDSGLQVGDVILYG